MPRRTCWALAAGAALAVSLVAHASPCTNPDAVTVDGGRYCGPLVDGRMHGRGVLEWDNDERYEGEFANGRYSGTGRLRLGSGETYEGGFRDGLMEGRGRMMLVDGSVYEGDFRKDYFNGQGRMESPEGSVYEGEFRNGQFNGRGRFTDSDSVYEGEFRDGLHWGAGMLTYEDGDTYVGAFERGRFNGHGRYTNTNGEIYEGLFRDGRPAGRASKTLKDGSRYEGEFENWRFQGKGVYTDAAGNVYEGQYVDGVLEGRGRFAGKNGTVYEGEFKSWRPHGQGVMTQANGDVYRGGFANGVYEGEGTLTYAKPLPEGRTQVKGTWRYGTLDDPAERAGMFANVETALYSQRHLLDRALAKVARQDPKRIDLYLLAIAGDGTQEVFRREVEFVRDQFAQRFRAVGRTVTLANSRTTASTLPMATHTSIREALKAIAARMDRENDILFLFLTSHGSDEHEFTLNQSGIGLAGLSAATLGEMLKSSGIRWKVVVVSACYGGGFIDAIQDDGTLFIAAARRDRQSFGCADENEFTYFGRAFFKEALPSSSSFQEAFAKAETLVRQLEMEHAVAPAAAGKPAQKPEEQQSLPQLHTGKGIERHLQRFWAQFRR